MTTADAGVRALGAEIQAQGAGDFPVRRSRIVAAGFRLVDLVEPEWPDGHDRVWGGWSPLRGRLIPGTAIFVCERSALPAAT